MYLTHSQGGRVGWQTDTENMAAIIAIEPGFAPEVGSDNYKKFVAAKIPIMFQELNNKEIAEHIEKWLESKGL